MSRSFFPSLRPPQRRSGKRARLRRWIPLEVFAERPYPHCSRRNRRYPVTALDQHDQRDRNRLFEGFSGGSKKRCWAQHTCKFPNPSPQRGLVFLKAESTSRDRLARINDERASASSSSSAAPPR